jgi:hypothetical protein
VQSAPREPEADSLGSYNRYLVDGIEIFIHKSVMLQGPEVSIFLGGFWKFRWLKVGGLTSMATCAI